jgi:hypothetical protein
MAAAKRNYELKKIKKSQSFIKIPSSWLDNSKFVESNQIFSLKNEMGWACGAYGGRERCAQGSGGET